ncbi:hypothetical protein JCM10213v2_000233 [Rhodosporidiobolus nylandii]
MPSTYHEPAAPRLLALIALFYLVQLFRGIANALLGAGLLGEIAVGVILGSPLGDILGRETEEVLIAVGYIGLVLIVFEGGLTLKPKSFLPLLPLALVVALLGILLPLAFTFALFSAPTYGYPSLQAFTAGSALASTSLGTTFYVLRAAGPTLGSTRVGEILKGAALIDDVIALVLLSVIQSLGSDTSTTALGWTIGRPVVASVGMAVIAPLVALYLARPLFRARRVQGLVEKGGRSAELFIGVAVLCAFLAIAYYTGTTMLLGAFLAGTFLTALPPSNSSVSFIATWDLWLIFVPLFFASIGFSLPFLDLWRGRRIWQGIIYSLLMALGKVLAGAPLLVLDVLAPARVQGSGGVKPAGGTLHVTEAEMAAAVRDGEEEEKQEKRGQVKSLVEDSLPAAAFLGLALVARGEIGVLVLQVAYSSSSASATSSVLSEEPYLLGIWAVALCTIVGPVAFGALVRRWGERVVEGRWGGGQGVVASGRGGRKDRVSGAIGRGRVRGEE